MANEKTKRTPIEAWKQGDNIYFLLPHSELESSLWEIVDAKQVEQTSVKDDQEIEEDEEDEEIQTKFKEAKNGM